MKTTRFGSVVLSLALSACSARVIAQAAPVDWVWSGAVTTDAAVVKAKIGGGHDSAQLVVGDRTFSAPADPNGIVRFELDGLTPGTEHAYRVDVAGAEGLAGRFRTFEDGPMSFDFAFGSCARTGSNHRIFATIESLEPLFFLHMGDFHYENIRRNDPALFRRAYDDVLASARQSSLYRSTSIVYMWDDHDYGPNDSDRDSPSKPAALATYDALVPHYPLERVAGKLRDLHQAFTVGRVRFLLTDVRSERVPDWNDDGPEKSLLGHTQREWLLGEMEAARDRYPLVVWVNSVPWITEDGSGHGWGRYAEERRYIADRIRAMGMVNRLVMLSGDAHMVAIDDGSNSNFATDRAPREPAFPIVHAGPLDRYPRPKGGPYSHGVHADRGFLFGLIEVQQFGYAEVRDDGEVLEATLTGRDERGDVLDNMLLTVRCEANSCRVLPEDPTL